MTADDAPDAVTGAAGAESEREGAALLEWAWAWAETFPAWSEERWANVNAALGYRLAELEDEE